MLVRPEDYNPKRNSDKKAGLIYRTALQIILYRLALEDKEVIDSSPFDAVKKEHTRTRLTFNKMGDALNCNFIQITNRN